MAATSESCGPDPDRADSSGGCTDPLRDFPIASTRSADEAEVVLSRELLDVHLRTVREKNAFRLEMSGILLGRTSVLWNYFGTDTVVDVGETADDALLVAMHHRGPAATIEIDGEPVDCRSHAALLSPTRRFVNHRPAGGSLVGLRADMDALKAQCADRIDRRAPDRLRFETSVPLGHGIGAHAKGIVDFAIDIATRNAVALDNPMVRRSLDDMVLGALLALPNSHSEMLAGNSPRRVSPGLLRRAEEFLADHAREAITVGDVVVRAGCSRRALFDAFRRYRGCTPMQFLSERRLGLAREALRSPGPDATVSSIALDCGFTHLSRFSAAYRKRYGEHPSETLRRA